MLPSKTIPSLGASHTPPRTRDKTKNFKKKIEKKKTDVGRIGDYDLRSCMRRSLMDA